MRRAWALLIGLSLVAVACGGDDGTSTDTTTNTTTTVAATDTEPPATEPPATEPPATEPATTEPPATDAPTTDAPAPAAIVPEVVCRMRDGDVAFAYTNEGDTPVVLDATASTVANSSRADAELITRVFAPGRVSPAFWASPRSERRNAPRPAWTVVGPDGVERTAAADGDTPRCTDELLTPTTPDDREPALVISEPVESADGDSVDVTFSVTGVPEASVCPTGLEPEPVSFTWDEGASGPEVTLTAVFGSFSTPDGLQLAATGGSVTVFDVCGYDGTTQLIWPGPAFEDLYVGDNVCLIRREDGTLDEATELECPGVPPTGGNRTRPN